MDIRNILWGAVVATAAWLLGYLYGHYKGRSVGDWGSSKKNEKGDGNDTHTRR